MAVESGTEAGRQAMECLKGTGSEFRPTSSVVVVALCLSVTLAGSRADIRLPSPACIMHAVFATAAHPTLLPPSLLSTSGDRSPFGQPAAAAASLADSGSETEYVTEPQ